MRASVRVSICVRAGFVCRCSPLTLTALTPTWAPVSLAAAALPLAVLVRRLLSVAGALPLARTHSVRFNALAASAGLSIYYRRLPEAIKRNLHFCIICKLKCCSSNNLA